MNRGPRKGRDTEMNQSLLDLYDEYKNELSELVFIAESSPQQFKDKTVVESFSREFDKLVALTNLYGRLLGAKHRLGDDEMDMQRN